MAEVLAVFSILHLASPKLPQDSIALLLKQEQVLAMRNLYSQMWPIFKSTAARMREGNNGGNGDLTPLPACLPAIYCVILFQGHANYCLSFSTTCNCH
jgi:hypothetical protein